MCKLFSFLCPPKNNKIFSLRSLRSLRLYTIVNSQSKGIPCLTLRSNTERPVTVTQGTNQLVNIHDLEQKVNIVLKSIGRETKKPEFWDGKTATRVVDSIRRVLIAKNQ